MPEGGPKKMSNPIPVMCVGILLFPAALYILGSNEQSYMCVSKSIIFADTRAKKVNCNDLDMEDGIAFMSCPIKQDTLPTWTGTSFGATGLGNAISFQSAAASIATEMYQCVEDYEEERRGNNSVKVYKYKMEWRSEIVDVYNFAWTGQAIQAREYACPGLRPGQGGPAWPLDLPRGSQSKYAIMLKAGPLIIDSELLKGAGTGLPVNYATPMDLNPFKSKFSGFDSLPMAKMVQSMVQPVVNHAMGWYTDTVNHPSVNTFGVPGHPNSPHHGPHHASLHHNRRLWGLHDFPNPFGSSVKDMDLSSVNTHNSGIDPSGMYIVTCQQPRIGCIRIQFFKNWDTSVTMLAAVQGGTTLPVDVPASWGCGEDMYQALSGGTSSKKAFITDLEDNNYATTWTMRIVGLLLTWFAVYCCFAPIAFAIDVVGDCIRAIPCLGEFLEDLLQGMMTCLLCVVSCGFGCSCGLFVIAIVWIYMRPLIGGGLMLFCAALVTAVYFYGQSSKNKDSRNLASEMASLKDGEGNGP